jgi:hypothetical protein
MIPLTGNTEEIVKAGTILRDRIFQRLPLVLNFPHLPQLTETEKNKIIDKLTWLANHEERASFYLQYETIANLRPGTIEEPTKLTPTIIKWAGKVKTPDYKEPKQKIGNAKNGRIIRDAKGL